MSTAAAIHAYEKGIAGAVTIPTIPFPSVAW
jgi:hypothetical protein